MISEKTVERPRAIILEKLGMHDRLQLAELRQQSGRRRWVRRIGRRASGFYGDVLGSSTDVRGGVLW